MLEALLNVLEAVTKLFLGIFKRSGQQPPTPPPHPPPPPPPPQPTPIPPPPTPLPPPPPPQPAPIGRNTIMRDSTNGFDIPQGTPMVAGYIDGLYAWTPQMWAFHKDAYQLTIAINPFNNNGSILDVETGDATPAQAPHWVSMRRAAGHDPWVYMNLSTWPAVRAAFHAAGIAEPHYWLAKWDGVPDIPAGTIAKQYANPTLTGRHYDESIVSASWRPNQR